MKKVVKVLATSCFIFAFVVVAGLSGTSYAQSEEPGEAKKPDEYVEGAPSEVEAPPAQTENEQDVAPAPAEGGKHEVEEPNEPALEYEW